MPCIDFCIGGPHGHSSEVRKRADSMLRLSGCVLNHQVSTCLPLHLQWLKSTVRLGFDIRHLVDGQKCCPLQRDLSHLHKVCTSKKGTREMTLSTKFHHSVVIVCSRQCLSYQLDYIKVSGALTLTRCCLHRLHELSCWSNCTEPGRSSGGSPITTEYQQNHCSVMHKASVLLCLPPLP